MTATVETPSGKAARDENFPVGSWLIRAELRPHVHAFYRFAREADDIADNPALTADEKVRRLASSGRFVAAVIFEIDARSRTVSVWNGAMPPALYLDGSGELLKEWRSTHPALGVLPEHELEVVFDTYRWTSAGQFLAFSDGLVEAPVASDPSAAVLRVADVLRGTSAGERVDRLVGIIDSLRNTLAQRDDVAILAVDCDLLVQQADSAPA